MEASLARGTRLITTDVFFGIGGPSSLYTIFVCASAISKSKSIFGKGDGSLEEESICSLRCSIGAFSRLSPLACFLGGGLRSLSFSRLRLRLRLLFRDRLGERRRSRLGERRRDFECGREREERGGVGDRRRGRDRERDRECERERDREPDRELERYRCCRAYSCIRMNSSLERI
jgi:hypothetical protein